MCHFLQEIEFYSPHRLFKSHRLRVVAHTDWGADKSTLLKLYRSLIRSKCDYSCFIYGSTRKSYLRCLDSIHHLLRAHAHRRRCRSALIVRGPWHTNFALRLRLRRVCERSLTQTRCNCVSCREHFASRPHIAFAVCMFHCRY